LGIPIGLHWSWFVIFALVTGSLAWGYLPSVSPALSPLASWLLGAATSLLFFGSVLLHELGHSVIALRNQIPVRRITLFIFGGVAQIAQEPRTPGAEFRIAIAGALTSLALAVAFGMVWWLNPGSAYLAGPSLWLARINLMVALFNMIPGFPLDGGRVLRALVWKFNGNLPRATRIASFSGQAFALGFMGLGLWTTLGGNVSNGLWLVFIGWFLQNAAAGSYAQTAMQEQLHSVTVDQLTSRDFAQVSGNLTINQLVDEYILADGQRCFLVTAHGQIRGIITLTDVTKIPKAQWPAMTIDRVMTPWERTVCVQGDTELLDALRHMDDANVAQVPVMQDDRVAGILPRERVLHYVRLRTELQV
jgi:Zn-dependent protease/predicted transcriptional regulator